MVGGKANTFWPSIKRLMARMAPYKVKTIAVIALTVISVLANAVGPRVLGHATDLIFNGLIGGDLPAGHDQGRGRPDAAGARHGQDRGPGLRHGPRARAGRRLRRGRAGAADRARDLRRRRGARLAGGLPPQRRGAGDRAPHARRGRGQGQRAAAELLRPAAARRAAQPRHQRHRQRQPDPAADPEPAAHLGADGLRGAVDDVLDLAAARARRADLGADLDGRHRRW